jgi:hypothetical protein
VISGSTAWISVARTGSVAREEKARGPEPDATSACTCLSLVPVRACHHGAGGDAGGPLPDRDRAAGLLHLPTHGWTPISHARGNSPLRLGARARGRRTGQHDSTELDRTRVAFSQRLLPAT